VSSSDARTHSIVIRVLINVVDWSVGGSLGGGSEVAPGQYEIAPHFESANLAVDNNLFQMELLRETAQSNGYQVLFAEKPFAGINGSGKHNNWSFGSNLVPTFFEPTNPYFGLALAAFVRAADLHADLLRAAVASAGNDHRLGGHEAPPAIMSIYLGEEISRFFDAAKNGRDYHPSNNDAVRRRGRASARVPHTRC